MSLLWPVRRLLGALESFLDFSDQRASSAMGLLTDLAQEERYCFFFMLGFGVTPGSAARTCLWGVGDGTRVDHGQGKCSTHCTVSPAPSGCRRPVPTGCGGGFGLDSTSQSS